jgi:hypothetical protein
MYLKFTGGYDEIPESMDRYLNMYGPQFNKKLCEEAVSRMYSDEDNLKPYTKEQVDDLLKSYSIKPKRGVMYDAVYVANMCLFDFMGKSVPDERHLAMFIKDMLDDPDAVDGYIFSRFYADCMYMNHPIEWEDML